MSDDDSLFEPCKKSLKSGPESHRLLWHLCAELKLSPDQAMFLVKVATKSKG